MKMQNPPPPQNMPSLIQVPPYVPGQKKKPKPKPKAPFKPLPAPKKKKPKPKAPPPQPQPAPKINIPKAPPIKMLSKQAKKSNKSKTNKQKLYRRETEKLKRPGRLVPIGERPPLALPPFVPRPRNRPPDYIDPNPPPPKPKSRKRPSNDNLIREDKNAKIIKTGKKKTGKKRKNDGKSANLDAYVVRKPRPQKRKRPNPSRKRKTKNNLIREDKNAKIIKTGKKKTGKKRKNDGKSANLDAYVVRKPRPQKRKRPNPSRKRKANNNFKRKVKRAKRK